MDCGSDAAIDNVTVTEPDCGVPSDAVRIGAGLTGPCVDCDGVSGVAMGVGDVTSPSNNCARACSDDSTACDDVDVANGCASEPVQPMAMDSEPRANQRCCHAARAVMLRHQ